MRVLLLLALLCPPALAGQMGADASGVVGLWHLNEGSGTSAIASSGPYNGSVTGAAWVSGVFGKALYFDGTGDYVRIVDARTAYAFNLSNPFSVCAWVKATYNDSLVGGYRYTIFSKWPNSGDFRGYLFEINNKNVVGDSPDTGEAERLTFLFYDASGGHKWQYLWSLTPYAYRNKWAHVCAAYDGSNTKAGMHIYANGVEMPRSWAEATASPPVSIVNTTEYPYIGAMNGGAGQIFNGYIDDVVVFNRFLSSGEAGRIYSIGLGRYAR